MTDMRELESGEEIRELLSEEEGTIPAAEPAEAPVTAESGIYRYVLDGAAFADREEFFSEIDRLMTDGSRETGHNLDSFNDILRGGFGKHPYGAPVEILWNNFGESRENLGDGLLLTIVGIILNADDDHDCTLKISME